MKDEVIVLVGKDKGKTGNVSDINWKRKRVTVSGVNKITKAVKPTQENPSGGFSTYEAPLDISNVALVSPKTGKATRIRIEVKANLLYTDKRINALDKIISETSIPSLSVNYILGRKGDLWQLVDYISGS